MYGISHWLNQPVTYVTLIAMFVTWQVCDLINAWWKRKRERRTVG